MSEKEHPIATDLQCGFKHLAPVPNPDELAEFCQSRYYDLLRKGGRAPDLRRLTSGGEGEVSEERWLCATLYADVAQTLETHAPGKRVLDVGCGLGHFMAWMAERGFDVHGVEPSAEATGIAHEQGLDVAHGDLASYASGAFAQGATPFDAVVPNNVLEHVPDPKELLAQIREVLRPGGVV